jgi:hypothetical protein
MGHFEEKRRAEVGQSREGAHQAQKISLYITIDGDRSVRAAILSLCDEVGSAQAGQNRQDHNKSPSHQSWRQQRLMSSIRQLKGHRQAFR